MPPATKTRFVLAVAFAAAGLSLLLVPGAALAARGHELSFHFAEPGSGNGQLSSPGELAVDEATDTVFVLDRGNERVEYFDGATGAYIGQFGGSATPAKSFEELRGIAVDNDPSSPSHGDIYVIDNRVREEARIIEGEERHSETSTAVIDKFDSSGKFLSQITGAPEPAAFSGESKGSGLLGTAVDAHGDLWAIDEASPQDFSAYEFDDSVGNLFKAQVDLSRRVEAGEVDFGVNSWEIYAGLAVDSADDLYIHAGVNFLIPPRDGVAKVNSTGRTINSGEIYEGPSAFFGEDFESASGLTVEAGTDDPYVDNGGAWRRFTSAGRELEHLTIPGGGGVGMAVDAATQTVYVASPSVGVVYAYAPEAPAAPRIEAVSALDITATSTTLEAQVNPRSEPAEVATTYHFEYLTQAEYQANVDAGRDPFAGATVVPEPDGEIPPSYEIEVATARIQGLQNRTPYRYRFSATNSHGGVTGAGSSFTTQTSTAFSLLDSRGWELVSPPEKRGAELVPIGRWNVDQASVSGDAVTYPATASTEADPEGNAEYSQVLSVRGPDGWTSRDLAQPHPSATSATVGSGQEYRFFSEDLSTSVLQPFGAFEPSLSPVATERTAYLRSDFLSSQPPAFCGESCLSPLVSAENATSGQPFGEEGTCILLCGPEFITASPDGRSVVLRSNAPLLPGAAKGALYEYLEGTLRPISVRPTSEGGSYVPAGGFSIPGDLHVEAQGASADSFARGAVSDDGSRVFFTEIGGNHHLFMRYFSPEGEGTLLLDSGAAGAEKTGPVHPRFQWATPDGSRVIFTDEQRLTVGSGAEAGKPDLYECAIAEGEEGAPSCTLTDLTPMTAAGESAGVIGGVLGASDSAEAVYFVADGILASDTGPGGEVASPGGCVAIVGQAGSQPAGATCNLYLRQGGHTTYIATLSGEDDADFWFDNLSGAKARVSPDGRWLAFMSQRALTGYDNRDALSGRPDAEVFLYHADGGGGPGELVCASCDPTGGRPHGVEFRSLPQESSPVAGGGAGWTPTGWVAGMVPGYTPYRAFDPVYQSRYLSDGGRLFFNSDDALVPADSNGTWDVYEYEPPAGGGEEPPGDTCGAASPNYSPTAAGCIDLVSSGTSPGESGFLDASEGGQDVFFFTQARLSSRDRDTVADVYDARTGGGEVEEAGAVRCLGDACQPPAAAPTDPTPGSLTFDGAGNVVECPKGKQLKGGKCIKQQQKKHKKAKKHSHKKSKKNGKKQKSKRTDPNRGGAK